MGGSDVGFPSGKPLDALYLSPPVGVDSCESEYASAANGPRKRSHHPKRLSDGPKAERRNKGEVEAAGRADGRPVSAKRSSLLQAWQQRKT